MSNDKFINKCKELVKKYTNFHLDNDNSAIGVDNVYVVWICKTLQNNKALLSTTLADGLYYECTYNGDKKELYFDVYEKMENQSIIIEN